LWIPFIGGIAGLDPVVIMALKKENSSCPTIAF